MGFTNGPDVVQEVTLHSCKVWEEVDCCNDYGAIKTSCISHLLPFALTHQRISKRLSSLRVRSVVEFGRARHHGELHRRAVLIHHPKEFLNQTGELRVGMQLLLERHGDAFERDVVVGGADAPRSDEVRVLR